MSEVNYIAAKYLAQLLHAESLPVAETILDDGPDVVLMRSSSPVFFAGTKRDGSHVWAHEERFAKRIPERGAMRVMYQLGSDEVYPVWANILS